MAEPDPATQLRALAKQIDGIALTMTNERGNGKLAMRALATEAIRLADKMRRRQAARA
jgi:hypothetical protein